MKMSDVSASCTSCTGRASPDNACVQAAACVGTCGLSTPCPTAQQTLEEAAEERGRTGTTAGHPESADSGGLLVEPEPLTPLRNDLPSETPPLRENHFRSYKHQGLFTIETLRNRHKTRACRSTLPSRGRHHLPQAQPHAHQARRRQRAVGPHFATHSCPLDRRAHTIHGTQSRALHSVVMALPDREAVHNLHYERASLSLPASPPGTHVTGPTPERSTPWGCEAERRTGRAQALTHTRTHTYTQALTRM